MPTRALNSTTGGSSSNGKKKTPPPPNAPSRYNDKNETAAKFLMLPRRFSNCKFVEIAIRASVASTQCPGLVLAPKPRKNGFNGAILVDNVIGQPETALKKAVVAHVSMIWFLSNSSVMKQRQQQHRNLTTVEHWSSGQNRSDCHVLEISLSLSPCVGCCCCCS